MDIKTYLSETGTTQHSFARTLGVTQGLVYQWVSGVSPPPIRCVEIESITSGKVCRRDLRPEDWHLIWPELAAP